jgi:hypothetical protein
MTSERHRAALHIGDRNVADWREVFTKNLADPDEVNFIIQKAQHLLYGKNPQYAEQKQKGGNFNDRGRN